MKIPSQHLFKGDRVIWIVYFLLCMISLVEVFSAASSLSYKSGDFMAPLFKQAAFLAVGTIVALFFHAIPCRYFKIIPILCWPICIILLFITLIWGTTENGGARWLSFFGIQFQPSEIAKGVVVITTALILTYMQREDGADRRAMKIIVFFAGSICLLIFPENLSTAGILFGTVFIMMYIGRIPLVQLGKLIGIFLAAVAFVVLLVSILPKETVKDSAILHRVNTWETRLNRHNDTVQNDTVFLREKPQTAHALIAIASSNVIGKMPGNSSQRDRLYQAYSDFIYAIVVEELGIFGSVLVVFLYIILLFRAGRIASRCERNFPAFLVMGLTLLLVSQAMINLLVAVDIIPVTGQPLPLISRGGTSIIINCVYFGMILSVSRYARKIPQEPLAETDEEFAEFIEAEKKFQSDENIV